MTLLRLPIETDFDALLEDAYERLEVAFPGWRDDRSALAPVVIAENVRSVALLAALTADVPGEILKIVGEQIHGIPPIAAAPATARSTWVYPTNGPHTIPLGTEVELVDGTRRARFAVTAEVTIAAGTNTTAVGGVTLAAVDAGVEGNGYPAQTGAVVDTLDGPPTATTIEPTAGGVDAESDETYKARLVEERRVPVVPILDWHFAVRARSVAGVARAVAIKGMDVSVARNETQTVTVTSATGGTFTLTFSGQTTGAIAHNATAAAVQAALEALSNIEPGDIIVTGGPLSTAAVTVEFTGKYRFSNVAAMTATSSLTGAGAAVAVATTQEGVAPATGQEGMVSVFNVDAVGAPVPASVKTAVAALLSDENRRIANVAVHVADATYNTVSVVFAGKALPGWTPSDVETRAEAAVLAYLDRAKWGTEEDDPAAWVNRTVVRHQDLSTLLNNVDGFDYWTTLTINGVTADLTMNGPAPLPAAASSVAGTVTA